MKKPAGKSTKAPSKKPTKARPAKTKTSGAWKAVPVSPAAVSLFEKIAGAMCASGAADRSRMFASEGLRVARPGGKYFAVLARGRLVLKLPADRVSTLVASKIGRHFEPGPGRIMKEWIEFDYGTGDWPALVREAHAFVGSFT